uniref:Uncharacterized protein n=1 Tax=Taiwanofungus camphoratus TaxID=2696576 RepID=A0A4D6SSL0_TAICA|nr:hypothetical protein [Taiwanofungus camphoratus]QCG70014.1 hypothetical protein [Taiwanofungus camphoratus]UKQ56117.1 hypothetical protein [Taiwanofungus camphoratus]WRO45215.1 hypothetical protein [Taiwanofungus sp. YW-2023a]
MRLEFIDGSIKTLHKGLVLNYDSLSEYTNYCKTLISYKGEDYTDLIIKNIEFNYFLIDKEHEQYYITKWSELLAEPKPINLDNFGIHKLPCSTDYGSWGRILIDIPSLKVVTSGGVYYHIFEGKALMANIEIGTLIKVNESGNELYSFVDTIQDCGAADFKRIVNNITYYIQNDKIVLTTKELHTKFLSKLKTQTLLKTKMIIFDIETLLDRNNVHIPYLYCMFDGKKNLVGSQNPLNLYLINY